MGVLLAEPALVHADSDCIQIERVSDNGPQVFIDRPLISRREVTEMMIVCGNCAGDDPNPVKTLMTKAGCCASCGGRSYVLAANLEIARRIAIALNEINIVSIS